MSNFVYRLPDVGEGLDRAEIMSWKVSVGDTVVPDQVLAEVETDKSMVEVPSPVAGIVSKLAGNPGDFIDVGASFVEIALAEEASDDEPVSTESSADSVAPTESEVSGAADDETGSVSAGSSETPLLDAEGPHRRVLASPATRRFAAASGVDLRQVTGQGPAGRVTKSDVEAFISKTDQPSDNSVTCPGPAQDRPESTTSADIDTAASASTNAAISKDEPVPFRGLRRTIAKNMVESWQNIPHITDFREIDATGLVEARSTLNAQLHTAGRDEKVTFLPFLIRAVAVALRHRKEFNSSLDLENEQITYLGQRNIGLAVSTTAGLFVPVIHEADSKMLLPLARESQSLAQKARDRTITSAEMSRGTFTITNFGSYGGWLGTPIIRPPEVAIAGFGKIADKVVAVDGKPEVRKVLPIAVSADHRVIDGADMGAFLQLLTQLLENPSLLMAGDF